MAITFTDYKNFPHGFRRSGDFSIKESERLERFGHLFQQLLSGSKKPENDTEKTYLNQLSGKVEATAPEVLAWKKYQSKITESKQYFPLCSTPSEAEISTKKVASEDGDVDTDIDVDVDDALEEGDDDDIEIEET